jgi:hypothetical protein
MDNQKKEIADKIIDEFVLDENKSSSLRVFIEKDCMEIISSFNNRGLNP